jgi:hypothetical protein
LVGTDGYIGAERSLTVDERSDGRRGVTRLSFIKSGAGLLAGAAAYTVPGAVAGAATAGVEVDPATRTPREPVVAYVRDARRGEVTILAGTRETTYRDRALARRILAAAPKGGGNDVVAP